MQGDEESGIIPLKSQIQNDSDVSQTPLAAQNIQNVVHLPESTVQSPVERGIFLWEQQLQEAFGQGKERVLSGGALEPKQLAVTQKSEILGEMGAFQTQSFDSPENVGNITPQIDESGDFSNANQQNGNLEDGFKSDANAFDIQDWTGYPSSVKPMGPFRMLSGEVYDSARKLANKTNASIHARRPELAGMQIHEIHPVKFGGSPTEIENKIALSPKEHARYTAFWNRILREQQKEK